MQWIIFFLPRSPHSTNLNYLPQKLMRWIFARNAAKYFFTAFTALVAFLTKILPKTSTWVDTYSNALISYWGGWNQITEQLTRNEICSSDPYTCFALKSQCAFSKTSRQIKTPRYPTQIEVPDGNNLWSDPDPTHTLFFQTKITGSGNCFARSIVWSEVTSVWSVVTSGLYWSDQMSFPSGLVWSEADSSAHWSDQIRFWAQLVLIRDHFARIFFFQFVVFHTEWCWLFQEATKKQHWDQRDI